MDTHRLRLRDAAVQRLRRTTTAAAAGAGVIALVFAGVAARTFPGRASHPAAPPQPATRHVDQSPPPLVPVGSPAPPASAPSPAPASAPPAAVSGGS